MSQKMSKEMSKKMWNKLLNIETVAFMKKASGDGDKENGEDNKAIYDFFKAVVKKVRDYKVVVMMAVKWDTYEDEKQANIAINYMGWEDASRFIMLMDYLSEKFKKGELK